MCWPTSCFCICMAPWLRIVFTFLKDCLLIKEHDTWDCRWMKNLMCFGTPKELTSLLEHFFPSGVVDCLLVEDSSLRHSKFLSLFQTCYNKWSLGMKCRNLHLLQTLRAIFMSLWFKGHFSRGIFWYSMMPMITIMTPQTLLREIAPICLRYQKSAKQLPLCSKCEFSFLFTF